MNFNFHSNNNGSNDPPVLTTYPVAASQTIAIGDVLTISGGQLTKGGDGLASVAAVAAQASDGADAGTMINVFLVLPSHVWRATATADATSHVLANSAYDINAAQAVDVADSANGCIQIQSLNGSNTAVLVRFTQTELA